MAGNTQPVNIVLVVLTMLSAALALLLSSPVLLLRMSDSGGSFPKPLSMAEEEKYVRLFLEGDMNARNVLIERNLRLVAHIIKA